MRSLALALALTLVLVVLSAGCLDAAAPASDARGAHPASSVAGDGGFTLRALVTDEPGGPPVEGASVVATFPGGSFSSGGSVAALTGPDGRAELHVPVSRALALTAWKAGRTLERAAHVRQSGARGGAEDVTIPLFREEITTRIAGKLGPAGASTRMLDKRDVRWEPQPIAWSASPEVTKAYDARLVLTNVTLTWTNGPTGAGDLLVAGGRTTTHADAVQDRDSPQFDPGPQEEIVSVPFAAIDRAGWRHADVLYVGAGTGKAWAAPLGLPYEIVVHGRFDGDLTRHDSPNGGLLAAIAGLAAGALVRRKGEARRASARREGTS